MYANLKVRVHPVPADPQFTVEHDAWQIETTDTGAIVVHLDAGSLDKKYAEPNGTVEYPRGTPIIVNPNW